MTFAISLIGGGAIVAGVAGIAMPKGERIAASLALVVGAGAGVIALAIGVHAIEHAGIQAENADYERIFLIASAIGFAAVLASSVLLWARTKS